MTIPAGSAAPQTPAGRLIELRRELAYLQRDLDEANAKASRAEEKLKAFTELGNVSFGGIAAAQIWTDFVLWELVLNKHTDLKAIFEIGTWKGGFSRWLWAQAEVRELYFATFDAVEPKTYTPSFKRADVFAEHVALGITFRAYEPCVVFCDGGNKPRELEVFSKELEHPESLLLVHDWGTETQPEDVPVGWEMLYREFCENYDSITRVFRKGTDAA